MSKAIAKIYLVNGIGLTSVIVASDSKYILLLDREGGYNLVNAEAISTVQALNKSDDYAPSLPTGANILEEAMSQLQTDSVHVFLLNGVRLDGQIAHIDDKCILLEPLTESGSTQIIKWSSVASIQRFNPNFTNRRPRD